MVKDSLRITDGELHKIVESQGHKASKKKEGLKKTSQE